MREGHDSGDPYFVEIADRQNIVQLDHAELARVVRVTLAAEQVSRAEISVALVTGTSMHRLNRKYLDHDYTTDVLSFLLSSEPDEDADRTGQAASVETELRGSGLRIDGEIVISAEMARDRAPDFGWTEREETILYLVHGLLHLAGYDDQTDSERILMRSRERAVLELCGVTSCDAHGDQRRFSGEDSSQPAAEATNQSGEDVPQPGGHHSRSGDGGMPPAGSADS